MRPRTIAEPYKIKMVEPIKMTTREYRAEKIREAGYNTFFFEARMSILTCSQIRARAR